MVRRRHRLLSILLSLLMMVSVLAVATIANASAAAGDTVFCENAAGWGEVYCYMWNDDSDKNGQWPGVKMTKGEGNLWSYQITGNWGNIIFNNGNGTQTADMSYQGNGSCFNNSNSNWSKIDVPTNPTTPTEPTPSNPNPTNPPVPSGKNVVYCKNSAGWGKVNVYMWNSESDKYKDWPGATATNIGNDVWMLEYTGNYQKIIFNDGGTQTGDLDHPGTGQMYDNKTGSWSLYDPTQLHIKGVAADPASPQYTGVDIKLTIEAGGGKGELSYKITVSNGSSTTTLSDFSSANSVVWTPTVAGTYTITYTVKDSEGNSKSQTASYKINDINAETKPVVQAVNVSPTNADKNQIEKGKQTVVDITAGGGNTGTKLLFYKVTITDPSGKTANVPYYTTKGEYKFTPAALGQYEIEVSVQGSDNSTVTRSYKYTCVDKISADTAKLSVSANASGKLEAGSSVSVSATAIGGTAPYTYQFKVNGAVVKSFSSATSCTFTASAAGAYVIEVTAKDSAGTTAVKSLTINVIESGSTDPVDPAGLKGDADCSGTVNIKDATAVQKHTAGMIELSTIGFKNAEVDGNGSVNVKDATMIQKYLAGIDVNW